MLTKKNILSLVGMLIFLLIPVCMEGQNIDFSHDKLSVGKVFKEIEKQTDFLISYAVKDIDLDKVVNLTSKNLPVEQALEQSLANSNHQSSIRGNHILILPKKAEIKKAAEPVIVKADPVVKQPEPVSEPELIVIQENEYTEDIPDEPESIEKPAEQQKEYEEELVPDPFLDINAYEAERKEMEERQSGFITTLPQIAVRTNLLYGLGTLTPNIGAEIGLTPRSSLLFTGSYNAWKKNEGDADNKKLWHRMAGAEYRYWLCERFNGHFFGANAFLGQYNISGKKIPFVFEKGAEDYRYEGWGGGIGISYGYQFMLNQRWNLELNAGVGAGILKYDKFDCEKCGSLIEEKASRTFFAPTSLGVSFIYIIK